MSFISGALKTACIDCTKYNADERSSEVLALVCHAAYLSVFYLASVFYAKKDLKDGCLLVGAIGNAGLGKVVKLLWRQPRPSAMCELLGKCESYGMPSSHTQAVSYVLGIYIARTLTSKSPSHRLGATISAIESALLVILTIVVGYARVHLGYHTAFQTIIGGLFGLIFGLLWAWTAAAAVEKHGRHILERWPILEAFGCSSRSRVADVEGAKHKNV